MKALIIIKSNSDMDFWKACLEKVLEPGSKVTFVSRNHLKTESDLIDALQSDYNFIVIPLALPLFNSIRIMELRNQLESSTRIILWSGTEANPASLRLLFDAFIPVGELSVSALRDAIHSEQRVSVESSAFEKVTDSVLRTSWCFRYGGRHWSEMKKEFVQASIESYRELYNCRNVLSVRDQLELNRFGQQWCCNETIEIVGTKAKSAEEGVNEYRVFLSYKNCDVGIVQRFAEKMAEAGLNPWYDKWDIAPGDSIPNAIGKGLVSSDVFVLFLSPESVEKTSRWVESEYSLAFHKAMTGQMCIIPLIIAKCEPPHIIRHLKYVNYVELGFQGSLAQLREAIQKQRKRR